MKKIAILVSMLLALGTGVIYAANVGDIIGGYPAGYNSANPGAFQNHIGEPITPVFTPTTTAQAPTTGFMAGPLPAGFSYKNGSDFREDLDEQETVDVAARKISMNRSIQARDNNLDFADNITLAVTGKNGNSGQVQYYVGYKLVNITW